MISQHLELKNIPYIHVLQPNQYFLGSKKLTKIELEKFYNYMPYKKPIESYYGMLSMQELNVKNKIDQRYLFKEEPRTVYSDNCCHFNKLGMKIIIRDIIERASPIFLKLLQNEKVD